MFCSYTRTVPESSVITIKIKIEAIKDDRDRPNASPSVHELRRVNGKAFKKKKRWRKMEKQKIME